MAYTTTNSTKRTIYSGGSGGNIQRQQPTYSQQQPSYSHAQENHVYEEQPYYSNDRPISGKSTSGAYQRTGGVC